LAAVRPDDVDRFLHTPTAGDDVFGYDKPLVRRDLKAASQHEPARLFLNENVPFPERTADLLPDNDSAQGGGDYGVALKVAQFVGQAAANIRGDCGVLEEQGALEKLPAVQAGAQHEMAVKQRTRLAEKRKQLVTHLGSARALACSFRRPRRIVGVKFAKARVPSPAREARALPRISVRNW